MNLYNVKFVVTSEDGDENQDQAYILADSQEDAYEEVELTYSEDDVELTYVSVTLLASDDSERPSSIPLIAFASTED